jgi:hypothetical protein
MIDAGESALYRATLNGEAWAVQFLLKTLGKSRGYVERVEQRSGGAEDAPPLRFDRTPVPLEQLPGELVETILEFITLKQAGKAAAATNGTAAPPAPDRAGRRQEAPAAPPPPPASDEDGDLEWVDAVDQA